MFIIDWIHEEQEVEFLLFREGMNEMANEYENIKEFLESQQDTAYSRLQNLPVGSTSEPSWYQHLVLAEIALQLAQINKHLESISKRLEEA